MPSMEKLWEAQWRARGPRSWKWGRFVPFALYRAYTKERLPEDAQAMVYVTLLTLVPLLAVAFALLRGFGVEGVLEPWLKDLLKPMGESGMTIVDHLIDFVNQTKAGSLGLVGVSFLFVSVINLAQKIETKLNRIWQVDVERSFKARMTAYISAVLLAPLLIAALMSSMLGMKNAAWLQPYLVYEGVNMAFQFVTGLLPVLMVFVIITCVYAWIPNRKIRWKAAAAGALFFLLLWYPISWIFSVFIAGSANYSVIYSSFASIVILLLWLYFLWLLFFMGAKVASLVQSPETLAPDSEVEWYANEQMKLGLAIMILVEKRFASAQSAPTLGELINALPSVPFKIQFVLERLLKAELLTETAHQPAGYLPSKAAELYTLLQIYHALAMPADRLPDLHPELLKLEKNIEALLDVPLENWID